MYDSPNKKILMKTVQFIAYNVYKKNNLIEKSFRDFYLFKSLKTKRQLLIWMNPILIYEYYEKTFCGVVSETLEVLDWSVFRHVKYLPVTQWNLPGNRSLKGHQRTRFHPICLDKRSPAIVSLTQSFPLTNQQICIPCALHVAYNSQKLPNKLLFICWTSQFSAKENSSVNIEPTRNSQ